MKKYKEIAAKGKYVVVSYDNNAVEVYVKQKITTAILHKIAGENGLKFHQNTAVENGIEWFAKKILDTLGDPKAIVGGEDCLYINKNNKSNISFFTILSSNPYKKFSYLH